MQRSASPPAPPLHTPSCHFPVQILNLEEAAAAKFTKAAFDGSTHYVQASEGQPPTPSASLPRVARASCLKAGLQKRA